MLAAGVTASVLHIPDSEAAERPNCHYDSATYSLGATVFMGRSERTCTLVDGLATWKR